MGGIKILRASAGSGKTYKLAYEYVRNVIESPYLYRNILAVTFTNKATEEMKRRIIGEINDLANGHTHRGEEPAFEHELSEELGLTPQQITTRAVDVRTKILHDYSHFTVLTIDKFFQRIIRSFIKEIGIDMNFTLELQTDSILINATDMLFDSIDSNKELRSWLVRYIEERMGDSKRWDMRSEIAELGRELFREAYADIDPQQFNKEHITEVIKHINAEAALIRSKIRDAAKRAVRIIDQAGLDPSDFSGGSRSFVYNFRRMAEGELPEPTATMRAAMGDSAKWHTKTSTRKNDILAIVTPLQELLALICDTYDQGLGVLNSADIINANYRTYAILPDLYNHVREFCDTQNIIPISETNNIINRLVDGNDSPFIFEKMGNIFSHFMIDEFQDTSANQWNNFLPLIANSLSQSERNNVLLVGDVKQSIYRWRGGDWEILAKRVADSFEQTQTIDLDYNYRSSAMVVDFNNRLIGRAAAINNDNLNELVATAAAEGFLALPTAVHLTDLMKEAYVAHAQKMPAGRDLNQGYVTVTQYDPQADQNLANGHLIRKIEELQDRGFEPSDIAILVRKNAEACDIATALMQHKNLNQGSKYSYDIVTQEALRISVSPAIRFVVACLRLSANPEDTISRVIYKRFLNQPITDSRLTDEESKFLSQLNTVSIIEAFELILMNFTVTADGSNVPYIQAFHEQLINFASTKIADIPLFLKWWDESGAMQSIVLPNKQNAITIITIHKSKGLQYKSVIIPKCDWPMTPKSGATLWCRADREPYNTLGRIPVKFNNTLAKSVFSSDYYSESIYCQVDNMNTLYVALTRAERELHVMMPSKGSGVAGVILSAISDEGDNRVSVDGLAGKIIMDGENTVYCFGTPRTYVSASKEQDHSNVYVPYYVSNKLENKVRIRADADRYFGEEDEGIAAISPRYYGNLMHKLFETMDNIEQLEPQIESMVTAGEIAESDAVQIRKMLADACIDSRVCDWFSGQWDLVRGEGRILIPHVASTKRPDRVMLRGSSAVVVDYKFGGLKKAQYARQVSSYMQLLRDMGYDDVRGYLWYVALNEIDEVLI